MSRIGKQPILIPKGVAVHEKDRVITIEGPLGALSFLLPPGMDMIKEDAIVRVHPHTKEFGGGVQPKESLEQQTHRTRALWGTSRAVLAHMIAGVTKGFEKHLEVEGIGYRAALEGTALVFALGFSHPVRFAAPAGITFKVEKNNITVSGISKELVGETARRIRALKPPEPYKGKGIRYAGEVIRRKAGKKAVGTT